MTNDQTNLVDLAERRRRAVIAKTISKPTVDGLLAAIIDQVLRDEGGGVAVVDMIAEVARRWASIEREACIDIVTRQCAVWDDGIFLGENIVAAIRARKQP